VILYLFSTLFHYLPCLAVFTFLLLLFYLFLSLLFHSYSPVFLHSPIVYLSVSLSSLAALDLSLYSIRCCTIGFGAGAGGGAGHILEHSETRHSFCNNNTTLSTSYSYRQLQSCPCACFYIGLIHSAVIHVCPYAWLYLYTFIFIFVDTPF